MKKLHMKIGELGFASESLRTAGALEKLAGPIIIPPYSPFPEPEGDFGSYPVRRKPSREDEESKDEKKKKRDDDDDCIVIPTPCIMIGFPAPGVFHT